jgi:hypothetical protein
VFYSPINGLGFVPPPTGFAPMPELATATEFLTFVRRSGLIDDATLTKLTTEDLLPPEPLECANALVKAGLLSDFQAKQLLKGRFRGFVLGPYKLVRPLGQGGAGVVYLAEHSLMKRKAAVKVLPSDRAKDQLALDRFYREARAVAALDHPNIVSLHDISQGGGVHFLVMEYVEGTTLQAVLDTKARCTTPRWSGTRRRSPPASGTPTTAGSSTGTSSRRT